MADQETFPMLASDLLDWLDEYVEGPTFPMTPAGVQRLDEATLRLGAFQAGARNLVNQLLAWREESENAEDDSNDPQTRNTLPRVLGDGSSVDETALGVRMVEGDA